MCACERVCNERVCVDPDLCLLLDVVLRLFVSVFFPSDGSTGDPDEAEACLSKVGGTVMAALSRRS